jgi:hypothetical protein
MSGLSEIGGLPGFATGGQQVSPRDIDRYDQYIVWGPSVDTSWIGTVSSATAAAVLVFKNKYPDYPRNVSYSVTGGASGQGGTFTLAGQDQFGGTVVEQVVIATANGGGTTQGTAVFAKYGAGTYSPNGQAGSTGTAAIGFGTASGITGNWFGLPVKIAGTSDVKSITWLTTNTPTTLNGGTAFGTLVSPGGGTRPPHAFQGTAGVAITDRYTVMIKSTFDNAGKPPVAGL